LNLFGTAARWFLFLERDLHARPFGFDLFLAFAALQLFYDESIQHERTHRLWHFQTGTRTLSYDRRGGVCVSQGNVYPCVFRFNYSKVPADMHVPSELRKAG
jgi:hypothetical protein